MEIIIHQNLIPTLDIMASDRQMTQNEYVEKYINNHLLSTLKQNIARKLDNIKADDIHMAIEAESSISKTISDRDYSAPVILSEKELNLPV
jgi:hypothetical protein